MVSRWREGTKDSLDHSALLGLDPLIAEDPLGHSGLPESLGSLEPLHC